MRSSCEAVQCCNIFCKSGPKVQRVCSAGYRLHSTGQYATPSGYPVCCGVRWWERVGDCSLSFQNLQGFALYKLELWSVWVCREWEVPKDFGLVGGETAKNSEKTRRERPPWGLAWGFRARRVARIYVYNPAPLDNSAKFPSPPGSQEVGRGYGHR